MEEKLNLKLVDQAKRYVTELFENNVDGHDLYHTLRVYKNAMEITQDYPDSDILVVSLAALLHDVDDHKLFKTENNANARKFLTSQNVDETVIEKICQVINSVSFSKNRGKRPELLEGKIVQDADRLDALGAIGIARTFAYGGKNNRPIASSVDHFHEKLLLLKDEMNTRKGKALAEKRHEFMMKFLQNYHEETKL